MTIEYVKGDLFESGCDALVNPVNCAGIMGRGLALQFKKRYPAYFSNYFQICEKYQFKIGQTKIYETGLTYPQFIISFATKGHWREKSQSWAIEKGLDNLIKLIESNNIKSIAIPALGCGEGKLNFVDVKPLMEQTFDQLPAVHFKVYEPLQPGTAIVELI